MSELKNIAETIEQKLADIRSKTEDSVSQAQLADVAAEIKSLQDTVAGMNTVKSVEEAVDVANLEKKAFAEYMSKGDAALQMTGTGAYKVKAVGDQVSLGVSAEGGILLPKVFGSMVDGILRKQSVIRGLATVRKGTGMGFITPFKTAKGTAQQRAELGAVGSSSVTTFNTVAHNFYEVYGQQPASVWATQGDVRDYDVVNILIKDVIESMAEYDANLLLNGTSLNVLGQAVGGVSSVKNGLLSQTKLVASVDRYTNVVGSLAGNETATAGKIHPDDFINLIASLHSAYMGNAKIVTSRDVLTQLMQVKDTQGRYLLTVGNAQEGFKASILGVEIVVDDFMPTLATAGTTPIALLADFSNAVTIADASDIAWTIDPYTNKAFVQYLARFRTSSSIVNPNAIRGLYAKASS